MSDSAEAHLADALEADAARDLLGAARTGVATPTVGGATLLIAPEVPAPYFNRVIGLGLKRAATEADVDAVIDRYRREGVKSFWIHVSPAAQPDRLHDWLTARGFAPPPRQRWAKFLRDVKKPPRAATPYTVRHATPADAMSVAEIIVGAYGMPATVGPWFAALVGRHGWQVLLALADDRPVAVGALFVTARGGWLGAGATLAGFRQHGAQSALLAARIEAAAAAGCTVVATETGEPIADEDNPSFDNIRRLGFRHVASRLNYASPPVA